MAAAADRIDISTNPNRPKDQHAQASTANRTDIASANLTPEETLQLMAVMRKAQEFEVSEERHILRQPLEGLLCKYTNVVTGWQYRWFVLNPEAGKLEYFEKEEHKKQRPRGFLSLAGAVVCPSDEDEQTFTVNAANSASYRLKAVDARERQHWVNRLRATAEHYAPPSSSTDPPPFSDEIVSGSVIQDGGLNSSGGAAQLSSSPVHRQAVHHAPRGHHQDRESARLSGEDGGSVRASHRHGSKHRTEETERKESGHRRNDHRTKSAERVKHLNSAAATPTSADHQKVKVSDSSMLSAAVDSSEQQNVQLALNNCAEQLSTVEKNMWNMSYKIESLPVVSEYIGSLDKEMLLLKATSGAMLSCLQQCLVLLKQQACVPDTYPMSSQQLSHSNTLSNYNLSSRSPSPVRRSTNSDAMPVFYVSDLDSRKTLAADDPDNDNSNFGLVNCCTDDGMEDQELYMDTELDGIEEHKNIILHLLSQLKLGMDLTKVVLPTFILEKRSLLEMFADCMAHPDLFLSIPLKPTAEERMLAVLEWYLTSFHAGRQGCIAKKPYNPIIGEHFHCSWRADAQPASSSKSSRGSSAERGTPSAGKGKSAGGTKEADRSKVLYYCAEQVSHHPPVSAFYFESPERQMCMEGSIWTRSKFMGMSIGVMMVGKLHLRLLSLGEEYEFSLPSAYARSILTVPWVELGDKVTLHCDATGYSASVVFHTKYGVRLQPSCREDVKLQLATEKPFYGGKLHRITSEVKNPAGEVICRVTGEWNGVLEFKYSSGGSKLVDTSALVIQSKCVLPLHLQSNMESRKLWHNVTQNLRSGDIDKATEHKQVLEEEQRSDERRRNELKTPFPTKYFTRQGDDWIFKHRLERLQTNS